MYVLYARRRYETLLEKHRELTAVLKAADHLLTNGYGIAIDAVAGEQPEQPESTLPPQDHPLIGEMVSITRGQHAGKSGIVRDVRPSKFNDGLCAFVENGGLTMYANVAHCCPVSPQLAGKPPAPSVRRPVARKANGSVPW